MDAANPLRLTEPEPPSLPPAPRTVEETGIGFSHLIELLVKTLFIHGELRLAELVRCLALPPSVLTPLLGFIRSEKLCEVFRRGDTDGRINYSLTDVGRARADDFMRRNRYVGATPVPLKSYAAQVESQSVARMGVVRERLRRAFDGVVVKEVLLDQFGAAMNSGRAIFVYGPAGSGKTYLAERLSGLLSGAVAIPHAIAVNGEVIQLFDPLFHPALPSSAPGGLERPESVDERWVLCPRPVVMCGAELTLDMVDLEFDPYTRFYHAPQQLKANNGVFIIDDLGRQLVSPHALMNRWIVPLDRHTDFLTLHTGQKFELPFDVIVVFSSNMHPSELADGAFLRRLGYKIHVGAIDADDYKAIVAQLCQRLHIPCEEEGVEHLLRRYQTEGRPLLACHPRDLLGQVCDRAAYDGAPPRISPEAIDWAWNNYFAPGGEAPGNPIGQQER